MPGPRLGHQLSLLLHQQKIHRCYSWREPSDRRACVSVCRSSGPRPCRPHRGTPRILTETRSGRCRDPGHGTRALVANNIAAIATARLDCLKCTGSRRSRISSDLRQLGWIAHCAILMPSLILSSLKTTAIASITRMPGLALQWTMISCSSLLGSIGLRKVLFRKSIVPAAIPGDQKISVFLECAS